MSLVTLTLIARSNLVSPVISKRMFLEGLSLTILYVTFPVRFWTVSDKHCSVKTEERISGRCKKLPFLCFPPASVGGSRCVLWFWHSVLLCSPGWRHQSVRCGVQAHGPVHTGHIGTIPYFCCSVVTCETKGLV